MEFSDKIGDHGFSKRVGISRHRKYGFIRNRGCRDKFSALIMTIRKSLSTDSDIGTRVSQNPDPRMLLKFAGRLLPRAEYVSHEVLGKYGSKSLVNHRGSVDHRLPTAALVYNSLDLKTRSVRTTSFAFV